MNQKRENRGCAETSPEVLVMCLALYHLNLGLLFLTEKHAKEILKATRYSTLMHALSQLLFGFAELRLGT